MKYWGKLGAAWSGFWDFCFGAAFFAIPGIGPVLIAGPLVAWIIGALEGAVVVGGLTAVGAGLYSIGIPKDSIVKLRIKRSRPTSSFSWLTVRQPKWPRPGTSCRRHTQQSLPCTGSNAKEDSEHLAKRLVANGRRSPAYF